MNEDALLGTRFAAMDSKAPAIVTFSQVFHRRISGLIGDGVGLGLADGNNVGS